MTLISGRAGSCEVPVKSSEWGALLLVSSPKVSVHFGGPHRAVTGRNVLFYGIRGPPSPKYNTGHVIKKAPKISFHFYDVRRGRFRLSTRLCHLVGVVRALATVLD